MMFKFMFRFALALLLIISLGPLAVFNIMAAQQAWHDSGLVFESPLLGIRF